MAIACSKDFTLKVNSGCVDWDSMVWTAPTIIGAGVIIAFFSQGGYHIRVSQAGAFDQGVVLNAEGTVNYAGDGCNCIATINYDRLPVVFFEDGNSGFKIYQDAVLKVDWRIGDMIPQLGTEVIPFSITATAGSVIKITGRLNFGQFVYTNCNGPGDAEYLLLCTNV